MSENERLRLVTNDGYVFPDDPTISPPETWPAVHPNKIISFEHDGITRWWSHTVNAKKNEDIKWEIHVHATAFARELINAKPIDLGDGVQQIPLTTVLTVEFRKPADIFTRTASRGVYNHVLHLFRNFEVSVPRPSEQEPNSEADVSITNRCVVVGNPGIGKSRNLLYLLKELLRLKRFVVFHDVASWRVFAFLPPGTALPPNGAKKTGKEYEVWSIDANDFRHGTSQALLDGDAFYLVNPGQNKENVPFSPSPVNAFMVIAASPNRRHFDAILKESGLRYLYMPMPTLSETKIIAKKVNSKLSDEQIEERFDRFGGDLRTVTLSDPDIYDARVKAQEDAAGKLSREMLAGVLSTVLASERRDMSFESGMPSLLWRYHSEAPYKRAVGMPLSPKIEGIVAAKYFDASAAQVDLLLKKGDSSSASVIFELVARMAIAKGGRFRARCLSDKAMATTTMDLPAVKDVVALPSAEFRRRWSTLSDESSTLLFSENKNEAVVDFVTSRLTSFQATVSATHNIALSSMKSILGLDPSKKGLAPLPLKPGEKLKLVTCVPKSLFDAWKAPQGFVNSSGQRVYASLEEVPADVGARTKKGRLASQGTQERERKKRVDPDVAKVEEKVEQWVISIPATPSEKSSA